MKIKDQTLIKIEEEDIVNGTCFIPTDITSIGNGAFAWCKELESIIIPKGVTSIGDGAFYGCKNLKNLKLPEGLISIANYVFGECKNLEVFTFPENLVYIGFCAFEGCKNLENITIPESVTDIDNYTFYDCKSLKQIQWGNIIYHVKCVDGICMNILHEKKMGLYIIYKCQYFPELDKIVWAVEKDNINAYGETLKDAVRNVEFKLLDRRLISEHVARIKSQGYVTPIDYKLITGAKDTEIIDFLKKKNLSWDSKCTVEDILGFFKGDGYEAFVKALKEYGCI